MDDCVAGGYPAVGSSNGEDSRILRTVEYRRQAVEHSAMLAPRLLISLQNFCTAISHEINFIKVTIFLSLTCFG